MQNNSTSQRGFTLIEMSIVLVIIGLIVGGPELLAYPHHGILTPQAPS